MPDNNRLQRLDQKEEVQNFLLTVVARFKAFKKRVQCMQSTASVVKRPQGASASKAKSSVLSELSGLENVLFNDFIDGVLDSEDVSEQRASASLPDSVPIESEEERTAREQDEIDALDAVGGCSTHTHTHKHAQLHTHKEKAIAQWAESLRCTAFVTKVQL